MRTDGSRARVLAYALGVAAVTGCGGAPAQPEGGGAETAGGEEPITCSVPNSPAMEDYVAGMRLIRAGDATGIASLERACDADNACACSSAGATVYRGELVPADVERGIALLARGCEGADMWGCEQLGVGLFNHRPEELNRAGDALATACEGGSASACQFLGRLRMSGLAGSEDAAEAVRLYGTACENGDVFACYFLGQAAAGGFGMDADPARARELLAWACEQAELSYACTSLAALDEARSAELLRLGCDRGDPAACIAITPPAPGDGTAAEALAIPAADAQERTIGTNEQESGGTNVRADVDLSGLGLPPTCVGFVGRRPIETIRVPAGVDVLEAWVGIDGDAVIAVRDATGRWHCNDDGPGGEFGGRVVIRQPPEGVLAIWGGGLRSGELSAGYGVRTEGVEPLNPTYATPTGTQSVTIPASVRARFYKMRVVSSTGVTGTVRLDGHDLWSFGPDGGTIESDEGVQCALTAGQHTLEIVVNERTRTAHGFDGGPLVDLELHGFAAAGGTLSDASRLFRIQWSPPEAPQTRTTTFRLSRAQAADRAQCAAASPTGG